MNLIFPILQDKKVCYQYKLHLLSHILFLISPSTALYFRPYQQTAALTFDPPSPAYSRAAYGELSLFVMTHKKNTILITRSNDV